VDTVEDPRSRALAEKIEEFRQNLERHSAAPDELLDELNSAFAAPQADRSLLSEHDSALFDSVGVDTNPSPSTQRTQLVTAYATTLAGSISVDELAERAGITAGRLRQRLNQDRTLWGFKIGGRRQWRVPAWELDGDDPLEGIALVAKQIPSDMHPVAVERMMTLPNPDLVVDDEAVSVRDWLLGGHDPTKAAEAIGDPAAHA